MLRHVTTYHYHSKVHATLNFSLKLAQLMALLVSLTCTIAAQQKSEVTQAPFNEAAYRAGEHLSYNVDFSHFVSAAHLELFVAGRGTFFNRDGIQLRAHVETVGVVNVALLSINNDYTTYVDPQTGLPFRAQQVVREAGRTSEAERDYNQPAGTDAIPPKVRLGEFPGTYDLLSAIYRVRALPLADSSLFFLTVVHDGDQYNAEVKVIGRERLKTNVGSFNTIVTRLSVKSLDYDVRVYFSDDERHVPVLITVKTKAGEIRAELAASELTIPEGGLKSGPTQPPKKGVNDPPVRSNPTPRGLQTPPLGITAQLPLKDVPFRIGEQLTYQVYLSNTPQQSVGTITFALKSRGQYFNRDGLLVSVSAQTTGAGGRVFPVTDQITSYIDPTTLLPFRTELHLSEGRYRYNRAYSLDQNRGAAVSDTKERIEIPVGTHDLISAFYSIRTFDLWPPKQNAISIMATSQPRTLLVKSQRRETIELGGQKIDAIMLTLTTDDPLSDKLQLRIWLGDDARHLPLRISAVTQFGLVRADLLISPITGQ
ncbi:MAG: hypothetical protein QOI77_3106 [Blastocatellia bacterium]|jgi:hypothetical protein|nr:hypothetical protein [Blastocatellia bacterium]